MGGAHLRAVVVYFYYESLFDNSLRENIQFKFVVIFLQL